MSETTTPEAVPTLGASQTADVWERTAWVWSGVFFVAAIVPLVIVWRDSTITPSQRVTALILVVLMLGSHVIMHLTIQRQELRPPLWISLIHVMGSIICWFFLVIIAPIFYFVLFGFFGQVFWFLPIRWAAFTTVLLMGIMVWQQTLGGGQPFDISLALLYGAMAVGGILMGVWIHAIIRQSDERKLLIAQLEATRSELAAAERKAGVLAERQRLAHEIHDTLAQGFISIIMHLEAAAPVLTAVAAPAQHHLNQAQQTARDNLAQARRVVEDLRPASLELGSLPEAITGVAAKWQRETGTLVDVTSTGEVRPLPGNVEIALLRGVQEALANIHKHAQATQVTVTLSYMAENVMLDVQDDGLGLTQAPASGDLRSGGYGLVAMRERVEALGGELLLESEPSAGTTVVLQIPLGRGS